MLDRKPQDAGAQFSMKIVRSSVIAIESQKERNMIHVMWYPDNTSRESKGIVVVMACGLLIL